MTNFTSSIFGSRKAAEPVGSPALQDDPAAVLWRGGARPAAIVGVLVSCAGLPWGGAAAGSAALGAVIAGAAMSVGPFLLKRIRTWSPPAVMSAGLLGYGAVVVALGVLYALLEPVRSLSGTHIGLGLFAGLLSWTVGLIRAAAGLRLLAFDPAQGDAVEPPNATERGPSAGARRTS